VEVAAVAAEEEVAEVAVVVAAEEAAEAVAEEAPHPLQSQQQPDTLQTAGSKEIPRQSSLGTGAKVTNF
jgi:hypothetical protein